MVPGAGLEPARPHGQWNLSPKSLSIPPPGKFTALLNVVGQLKKFSRHLLLEA